ncbi:MAG: YlbF family regulator [Mogibacterium sp.]|nr:YlbF family regulator [Mogibacterium sp.]
MNVYDQAHDLARAIRESGEFKEFDRIRKEAEQDNDVTQMLAEFHQLQIQLQTAQMTGNTPDQDMMSRMQSLGTMLATKPLAARYMQAEAAFTIMMNDVFGIIGEAVGLQQ